MLFKIYIIKFLKIILSFVFRFDYWHSSPRENRDYILFSNKIIKLKKNKDYIADIGCGLGEVTYNIKNSYIDFYDSSSNIIRFLKITKFFQKKNNLNLFDFKEEQLTKKYDVIVLLNFLHNIDEQFFLERLSNIYFKNLRRYGFLIFDIIDQNKNYKYNHKIKFFLEKNKIKRVFISNKMKFNRRIIIVIKN
mgnify:CR=1 FL=1